MTSTRTRTFAVIAGGGSGGHVLPGVAIAEALADIGHSRDEIVFVGSRRGMESTLVPPTGFGLETFTLTSFPRKLQLQHAKAVWHLARGLVGGYRLLGRLRPKVVISVGGYVSMPAVLAAVVRRIPIVVVSWDAKAGIATRFAARFARICAVGFDSIDLPRKVVTGAPLRAAIVAVDRAGGRSAARLSLGLPLDRHVIAVVGGSQGSGHINSVVDDFVEQFSGRTDLAIRHVEGQRNAGNGRRPRTSRSGLIYQPIAFEDQMPQLYAAIDLFVGRSGAGTVAELGAVGVASILVPWADAAEDHQTNNARVLADVGGAVLIAEGDFTAQHLVEEIDRLITGGHLPRMDAAARNVGRRNAAHAIATLVQELANS